MVGTIDVVGLLLGTLDVVGWLTLAAMAFVRLKRHILAPFVSRKPRMINLLVEL